MSIKRRLFKDFVVIPTTTLVCAGIYARIYCQAPTRGVPALETFQLFDWILIILTLLMLTMLLMASVADATRNARVRLAAFVEDCNPGDPIIPPKRTRPRRKAPARKPPIRPRARRGKKK